MNYNTEQATSRLRPWQADLALLLVTLIWGSTFVLVKQSVARFPVFAFLFLRFVLAALVLGLLFGRRLRTLSWRMFGAGLLIGLFLFGGYAFQTVGLRFTTASKAGFITGLSVVMVPVFTALLFRRAPQRTVLLGVLLATVGLALLTLGKDLTPTRGDGLAFGCAVCFALHIVAVSLFAPQTDALALTIVQVTTVALLSGIAALVTEIRPWPMRTDVCAAAAFTGVLATALAFAIQNSVQVYTTSVHTALIFASEPVFAGLFGYWLAGERLTRWGVLGCGLILLGMLLAELRGTVGNHHKDTGTTAPSKEQVQ
jgi:drug/metabolite transporter (DMT)-like permease